MRGRWVLWVVAAVAVVMPAGAWAVPTLSFDQTTDAGTLSYDGSGALVGTGIRFDSVTGSGTPLNAGVTLYCSPSPCLLGFTTGTNTDEPGPAGDFTYEWAGGGSFTLVGGLNTVADGSGAQVVAGGSTLLSGTWDDPVVGTAIGSTLFVVGTGPDTKHASLAAYFGVPITFQFSNTEISGAFAAAGDGSFAGVSVSNADIVNTAVPEPELAVLLLPGLVALTCLGRRRLGRLALQV